VESSKTEGPSRACEERLDKARRCPARLATISTQKIGGDDGEILRAGRRENQEREKDRIKNSIEGKSEKRIRDDVVALQI